MSTFSPEDRIVLRLFPAFNHGKKYTLKLIARIENQEVGGDVAGEIWRIDNEVCTDLRLYVTLKSFRAIKRKKKRKPKRKKLLCENCHNIHVSSEGSAPPEGVGFGEAGRVFSDPDPSWE